MQLNHVYLDDCVNFMNKLPSNFIDLTLTSPPYDKLKSYHGASWNFEATAKELWRITKERGVVVWVVDNSTVEGSESGTAFTQALYFKSLGFKLYDTMIYLKKNPVPKTHRRYEQAFEYMFVFTKGFPKTVNLFRDDCAYQGKSTGGTFYKDTSDKLTKIKRKSVKADKIRTNVWEYLVGAHGSLKAKHPAKFPIKLAQDHILSWSNEGDLVFDPFSGAGTTLYCAKTLNRNFLGCDCTETYVQSAKSLLELEEQV